MRRPVLIIGWFIFHPNSNSSYWNIEILYSTVNITKTSITNFGTFLQVLHTSTKIGNTGFGRECGKKTIAPNNEHRLVEKEL